MQPKPRAETSKLLFPSLRFRIVFLLTLRNFVCLQGAASLSIVFLNLGPLVYFDVAPARLCEVHPISHPVQDARGLREHTRSRFFEMNFAWDDDGLDPWQQKPTYLCPPL